MSPEMTTAATPQLVNMPRINSPFAAYQQQAALTNPMQNQMQFMQTAKTFPSTHMPSPWTTAQYLQSQSLQQGQCMHQGLMPQAYMHTGLQHGGFAQPNITNNTLNPGWGQATVPPVDIQVLNDQEAVMNNQNVKENTKVSWTSAEQLADAIFPSNSAQEVQTKEMHDGLLDHKTAIEALCRENKSLKTKLRQQQANTSNHEVLHSATAIKVSSLKQAVEDVNSNHTTLSSTTNKLSTSVDAHASKLNSLKTQQDAHSDGLINHRDVLRKCVNDISELRSSIKMHQQKTDDTWLERTSLSERTGALENQVKKLVASNNIINDHIGELKTRADSALDRNEVQMILAPRRKM